MAGPSAAAPSPAPSSSSSSLPKVDKCAVPELLQKLGDFKEWLVVKEEKLKAAVAEVDHLRKANEQLEEQSTVLQLQNDALLESQLKFYINLIKERRDMNIQSIMFLNVLRQNDMYATCTRDEYAHAEIISMCLEDFNEYAATLLTAEEEIKLKFETRRRSPATSLEFDLRRIERPKLTSNLFLLVLDVSGPPTAPNAGVRLNSSVPARISTPPSRVPTPPNRVNTPPGVRTMQPPPVGAGSSGFLQGLGLPPPGYPTRPPAFTPLANEVRNTIGAGASNAPLGFGSRLPAQQPIDPFYKTNEIAMGSAQSKEAAPTTVAGKNLKKNHDKLIDRLKSRFDLPASEANKYVMKLRDENGGKLSGMSMDGICARVAEMKRAENRPDCSICFEEMAADNMRCLEPCQHRFHTVCINTWLTKEKSGNLCPLCRNYVVRDDEYP